MGNFLFPDEYYDSTYSINFKKYYEKGYRAILFDVDNTLVEHNEPMNDRAYTLLTKLQKLGFKICFISNNKEPRVAAFNEKVGETYIFKAGKPSKKGYIDAMEKLGTNKTNTLFVGDQLFTDILGANNAGIHSILVKPIAKHEEIQIVLKRKLEYPILKLYLLKHHIKTRR